jgi:hypothetical protein
MQHCLSAIEALLVLVFANLAVLKCLCLQVLIVAWCAVRLGGMGALPA